MRKQIKRIIYNNNLLFNIFYKYLYRPKSKLDVFLNNYSKSVKGKLSFVQIGANDGLWNDPFYKYIRRDKWKGILIEPQKDIFENLKWNYRKLSNLFFENIAIDEKNGIKSLYQISFNNAQWASGLSSFNIGDVQRMIDAGYVERMAIQENIVPPLQKEKWIKTEEVQTLSFIDLINKYKYEEIDLLIIDVEGYEFEIIKTLPFDIILIKIIIYEHTHFNENKKELIRNFLIMNKYNIVETESDTIAIKNNLNIIHI